MRYAGGTVEPVDQVTLYLLGFNNTCRGYGLAGSADPRQLEEPSSSPSSLPTFFFSRSRADRRGSKFVRRRKRKERKKRRREFDRDSMKNGWYSTYVIDVWTIFFFLVSFLRCLLRAARYVCKIRVARFFKVGRSSKLIGKNFGLVFDTDTWFDCRAVVGILAVVGVRWSLKYKDEVFFL